MPGAWIPDPLAPSGFRWQRAGEQPPTTMLPMVTPDEPDEPDHDELEPVAPAEFPAFDGVTSLMIRSIGAPE